MTSRLCVFLSCSSDKVSYSILSSGCEGVVVPQRLQLFIGHFSAKVKDEIGILAYVGCDVKLFIVIRSTFDTFTDFDVLTISCSIITTCRTSTIKVYILDTILNNNISNIVFYLRWTC